MSAHRFFLESSLPSASEAVRAPLAADDLKHAVRVLRIRAGETVELVDPSGTFASSAEVVSAGAEGMTVRVTGRLEPAWSPTVTLVQGVAKGDKMDAIVRQATELGAAGIVPVLTERSVVRLDARKGAERGARWRRVAHSASEQSRRFRAPVVSDPVSLAEFARTAAFDVVVVLWEEAEGAGIAAALSAAGAAADDSVAVVVGPEGGLSATEVAALRDAGAVVASLGPTVLRTETAAVVSTALALHALGGLGDA